MKEKQPTTDSGIIFQDKKEAHTDFDRITKHIQESHAISKEMDVGQEEATVILHPDYPNLPVSFLWMTDIHYGNMNTQYDLLNRHFQIVERLPNTYIIFGGDIVDNFSAAKHPVALLGDAVSPQIQTQAMMEKIKELDRKNKVLSIGYGNHEEFIAMGGYDYYQSFMGDLSAPIFSKNGVLNLIVGRENYRIGIFHKFWGKSKLNVSNAPKRAMEYGGYPNLDIVLIGDDHQATSELFSKGQDRKLVIDGGTYKWDATGARWGLGHAGKPGYSVFLWPDQHKFESLHDPETMDQMMRSLIYLENQKQKGKNK